MAVNNKNNVVINSYLRAKTPVFEEGFERYLQDELQRIEAAIRSLAIAAIEVLDEPPLNPVKGMVKYNVSPWDAIGDGTYGLCYYDGTSWNRV